MNNLVNSEEDGLETKLDAGNQLGEITAGLLRRIRVYGSSGTEIKGGISKLFGDRRNRIW